jgi:hypothetical protein
MDRYKRAAAARGAGRQFGKLMILWTILREACAQGAGVPLLYNDVEHWRKRAKQARAVAEKMTNVVNKKAMMEVAVKYDEVAARAAQRLAQLTTQSK